MTMVKLDIRSNETINDSPDAMTMSWDVTADPVSVKGFKPTAQVVIDSTKVDSAKLQTIIDTLYGTDPESQQEEGIDARLLTPDDIADILNAQ